MDWIENRSFGELQVDDSASLGTLTYKDIRIFCDRVLGHKPVSIMMSPRLIRRGFSVRFD
jgi:hypothetical protein